MSQRLTFGSLGLIGLLALFSGCTIDPFNLPPTAEAGADQNVEVAEQVSLNGLSSTDPDGDPLTFNWQKKSGPDVTLNDSNSAIANFVPSEEGDYEFALTVTDDRGGSDVDTVRIFVVVIDPRCPRADAGLAQLVNESGTVVLSARNSADPNGGPLEYDWFQLSGPQVSISGVFTVDPSFVAPEVDGDDVELEFELEVTNDLPCTKSDTVLITVRDRTPEEDENHPCSEIICEDDGLFCNGIESCEEGECVFGSDPCRDDQNCDENDNTCVDVECLASVDCVDEDPCTMDGCVDGLCENTPMQCLPGQECVDGTCEDIPGQLVARWEFNEGGGTSTADSSGNGHDGTVYGASWTDDGLCQAALCFDAVDDYVYFGTSLLDGEVFEQLTVESWVKTDGQFPSDYNAGWDYAFAVYSETTDGEYGLGITKDAGRAFAIVYASTGGVNLYGPSVSDGQWHHLRVTLGATQTVLYVDGVAVDSASASGPLSVNGRWHVTVGAKFTDDPAHFFPGCIDEVAIYDSGQGNSLDSDGDGLPDDCVRNVPSVARWRFDEGAGTSTADSSGNGHDGTVHGASWTDDGLCQAALCFDAVDDYVYFGTGLLDGEVFEQLTVESWLKTDGQFPSDYNGGWDFAFAVYSETTDGEYGLGITKDAGRAFAIVYASTGGVSLYGPSVSDGQWHHLRVTLDESETILYVDGVAVDSASASGPLSVNGRWHVTVGAKFTDDPAHFFPGCIDEVAIYDSGAGKTLDSNGDGIPDDCGG